MLPDIRVVVTAIATTVLILVGIGLMASIRITHQGLNGGLVVASAHSDAPRLNWRPAPAPEQVVALPHETIDLTALAAEEKELADQDPGLPRRAKPSCSRSRPVVDQSTADRCAVGAGARGSEPARQRPRPRRRTPHRRHRSRRPRNAATVTPPPAKAAKKVAAVPPPRRRPQRPARASARHPDRHARPRHPISGRQRSVGSLLWDEPHPLSRPGTSRLRKTFRDDLRRYGRGEGLCRACVGLSSSGCSSIMRSIGVIRCGAGRR